MKKILVPVDGSESANRAAAFAATLARAFGSSITLLHVYDAPTASLLGLAMLAQDEVKAALSRSAQGSFEGALRAMGDTSDLSMDQIATTGHPFEQIVSHARSLACEIIVMGSRGLSPVEEIVLGSVSDKVARLAPCVVTIVR